MKTTTLRFAVSMIFMGLSAGVAAHHSFSAFDEGTETKLDGVVVEFQWKNPHTWLWLDVTNEDGSVTRWGVEGSSPNILSRRGGWDSKAFQPGDQVQLIINPMKNGEPGGMFLQGTLADGSIKTMFGGPRQE